MSSLTRKPDTRRLVTLALFAALAYMAVFLIRIPVVLFLKYEPKDVLLVISGFLYGPVAGVVTSAVVALVEMVTISDTGPIGLVMNILSSVCFVLPAALIYRRDRTLRGAVIGLISGALAMVAAMLLWNYAITPLYMELPRAAVADMLLPVFLPFNALKGGLNASLTLLLYKPLTRALRAARLLPAATSAPAKRASLWVPLAALAAFAACVVAVLFLNGTL